MADRRGARVDERPGLTLQPDDRKHLTRVGSLLIVVLGALLLGAILRQGPPAAGADDAEEGAAVIQLEANRPEPAVPPQAAVESPPVDPPRADAAPLAPPAPAGAPRPAAEAGSPLAALADRAGADLRRLPRDEAWMLQLAAICDPANAERLVGQVERSELYLLPVEIRNRACFRVCWGPFDSRDHALAAVDDLPGAIRSLSDAPQPRRVDSLVP